MKPNTRMIRINEEIQRELAQIVRTEIQDPRVGSLTSVIRAQTTSDLKFCKVFVSVLGNDEEKQSVMVGLKNASGFMRRLLAERINLRNTPELTFKLDDSLEHSIRMNELMHQISKGSKSEGGNDE